ncbi:MBL fold metallo-hydrolase [Membranihabitans maritimus]|uniref:MBL fold metallo-hydrolase n=1 Tax=Membranihabitans maritimus TaxID=2904244 RepID=UPI001F3363E4|nr:rhodanese-like domain-containing protein [Membranihabitans maritimus]
MSIEQFYDKALAHGSYAIESDGKVALVDPGRDIKPYVDFAKKYNAEIVAVFETHPHADFASSHLEIKEKFGATIYINPKVGVAYDFTSLEHNDEVNIGSLTMKALFTPGHSPDHNSYLLLDARNKEIAVFTGDSLFIGDVGRPDLREGAGNIKLDKRKLAGMMYDTLHDVFAKLSDHTIVYPAHGAGSLCGKNLSDKLSSTIGEQKAENWAFSLKDKETFIESFLEGQSFIPKYFPYDVELNRKGVAGMETGIQEVPRIKNINDIDVSKVIIDARSEKDFKEGHLSGAINIQNTPGGKFETWLGSIVSPEESFYLVADSETNLENTIYRAAKIGYETLIEGALVYESKEGEKSPILSLEEFKNNTDKFTIVDIRNKSEVAAGKIFEEAINIPLSELRENVDSIKGDKPVVVHCAGGYRSAAGSSILEGRMNGREVYDLSDAVNEFK